jgi:hypothetical protein
MKELTDEEILALWIQKNNLNGAKDILDFARAIEERQRKKDEQEHRERESND